MRKTSRITLSARALLGLSLAAAATACASNDTVLQNQQLMRTVKIAEVERLQPAETVAGCAERALPRAADPAARLDPGAWQRMQDYSREHQGVGLIVMVDGQVVGESYRPGAGPQTHTQSQSMHKSIVGLAYGAAIRDRLIGSVNDPVANYLPEWRGDARGALPLRSFLTMSSPLTNFSVGKQEPLALALIYSDAINAAALATPIVPGTPAPFAYKNVDAQIAGLALERAIQRGTGQRYAEWLSKSLWCPLGNGPATLWLERAGGSPRYYAGLQTGLRDWARVGQMIADGGRVGERQVLPAAWIAEATAPSADNPQYGYLMWRGTPWAARRQYNQQTSVTVPHSAPYAVDDLVFFDGFGGQRVYVSPSRRLVIARTGETDLGFDDAVLPNLALAGLRPDERSEAIYHQRLAAMFDGGETNYEPRETVPGAPAWRPWPVASASQRTIRDDALSAATAYAAARKSSAFLVWHRGQVQAAAYFGNTQPASLLVSKSLSKPMTAIAIGRAIALGKIRSVDQPVADFLPEWKGTPKAAILLRHLLDMRSGLLQQSFVRDPESPLNRAYLDPDHGRYLINDYPLTDAPGSRYVYSNASAELVALVIERSTGMRYAEFIGREVLAPIGAPGGQVWLNRPGGLAHSGCCMLLPAESWLRLGVLLLNDGMHEGRALLPAGFVRDMTTATPQNPHYGLGVWVAGAYVQRRGFAGPGVQRGPQVLHSEPYLDRSLFLFDGNANQTVYVSPATNMVILRLGDTPPAAQEWDNSQLPNLLIRGAVVP